MADTLDRLLRHHGPYAKGVIWAHNTHVGDARATDMAAAGMINVGQVVRERHHGATVSSSSASAAMTRPSMLVFGERRDGPWLSSDRGHRAIGVVYQPERDRHGNWVPTVMGRRHDAFLSFAATEAVHPLHPEPSRPAGERDTYLWST